MNSPVTRIHTSLRCAKQSGSWCFSKVHNFLDLCPLKRNQSELPVPSFTLRVLYSVWFSEVYLKTTAELLYDSKQSVGRILKYSALLFFKCTNRTISLGFICWTQFRVMNRPKCWHYYIFWQQSRLIEMIELCLLIVWSPGNWTSSVSDSNLSSFNLSLYRFLWKH